MGFVGMFLIFVMIWLIVMGIMGFLMILFFIIGMIQKKRGKKSGKGFLIASAVLCCILVTNVLIFVLPVRVEIDTPYGKDHVWSNQRDSYFNALYDGDTKKVGKILDKNSKLIYAVSNGNDFDGLHCAIIKNDIETAQCIIDHGGAFDSGYNFFDNEYKYSLECYFDTYFRRSGLEDLKHTEYECVKFMIDNNAKVEYDSNDFSVLFYAVESICYDGSISDEDVQMIKLLTESGADITDTNAGGETPYDVFMEEADIHKISQEDKNKIIPLIETK